MQASACASGGIVGSLEESESDIIAPKESAAVTHCREPKQNHNEKANKVKDVPDASQRQVPTVTQRQVPAIQKIHKTVEYQRYSSRATWFGRTLLSSDTLQRERGTSPCPAAGTDRPISFSVARACTGNPDLLPAGCPRFAKQAMKGPRPLLWASRALKYREPTEQAIIVIATSRTDHFILIGKRSGRNILDQSYLGH